MNNILVTGGAGFIGSYFVKYLLNRRKDVFVVNLDDLTYAGNLKNLESIENNPSYKFVKANITDQSAVARLFEIYSFDYVVNFAAESHVDRSIDNPQLFLQTNIIGTQNLLSCAMKSWKIYPNDKHSREYKNGVKYLQVSTDEVYGSLGRSGLFTETTPLAPNSPYSASKASADLLVRAYNETFGLPINITRCSNNYGPNQFPEKLIPLVISNCINNKKIPVYGDGLQIRDWLFVEDHCSALFEVLFNGKSGEVYNIGGINERANIEIVRFILSYLGKSEDLIQYVADRPGHDRRYAIDNSKIKHDLNWNPKFQFDEAMRITIDWYMNNTEWINEIINGTYAQYYSMMYKTHE